MEKDIAGRRKGTAGMEWSFKILSSVVREKLAEVIYITRALKEVRVSHGVSCRNRGSNRGAARAFS